MKALILFLTAASGNIIVPCPAGGRIRITTMQMTLAGTQESEQLLVTLSRTNQVVATLASQMMTASILNISAFIGADGTIPRQAMVNPATGAVTYDNLAINIQMSLPHLWWDFEVLVSAAGSIAATVNPFTLTYELELPSVRRR